MNQSSTEKVRPPQNAVTITRVFDAPRELVWKAWTDPQMMMRWWGPKGWTCPVCKMDVRVGGKVLSCMRGPDGMEIWGIGTYLEVAPPSRFVMTDSFADAEGNVVPSTRYGMEGIPLEMLITVTLEERQGKTVMTLTHAGLPPGEHSQGANAGWNESFDKLAEALRS